MIRTFGPMRMALSLAFTGALVIAMSPGVAGAAELDHKRLAKQVAAVVAPAYPDLPLGKVTCPKKIKKAKGTVAVCIADTGGLSLQLRVTQTDGKGNVAIESTQAVIPKAKAEAFVAANATLAPQVDCGPDPYLVRPPGFSFGCTARFADGTTQQVTLSIVDVAGNVKITQVT